MSEFKSEKNGLCSDPLPNTNNFVNPMLTDMYQISMTYAHWKNKKVDDDSIFDLFFRKNPFQGEYCVSI
jgi:nicotinate phosphoribosyltransferase